MEKQKKVLNVIKGYMSKFDIEELTIIEDDEDSVIFSGDVEKFLHPCETMQNEAYRIKMTEEVSEIIEQAAEAATVLKKTEYPEHPEKIKAAGGENLQDALLKVGISAKEALTAFESIYRLRRQEKSNNWRKYHGLPLKRSKGGKRRGDRKRNDSNPENTGIS